MKIEIDGITYEPVYFPFFRTKKGDYYSVFVLRYPSGLMEEFMVFDDANYMEELKKHLAFLIKEYMLEDDEMLTPFAKRLKDDVYELFHGRKREDAE